MTRGRIPARGLEIALPIAAARGHVQIYQRSPRNHTDFTITGSGIFASVRLHRTERLHATPAEIGHTYRELIAELRSIPGGGPVSRELWLYTRHGTTRHFRVDNSSIAELDRIGLPLPPACGPAMAVPVPPAAAVPGECGPAPAGMSDPEPAGSHGYGLAFLAGGAAIAVRASDMEGGFTAGDPGSGTP